jgi:acyl-CoA thioester hydrolase
MVAGKKGTAKGAWVETFKGAVLASEYDPEGTMNSGLYTERFDQATWFLLHAVGVTPRGIKRAGRRIGIVRTNFQFLRELRGGELVTIESGFIAVGRKHLRFLHRMFDVDSGRMLATNDCVAVQASLKTGKTVPLPKTLAAKVQPYLITETTID